MRCYSSWLIKHGKFIDGIKWYLRYLKTKLMKKNRAGFLLYFNLIDFLFCFYVYSMNVLFLNIVYKKYYFCYI